jgi:hypothetical protein
MVLETVFDWLGLVFEGGAIHFVIEADYMERYGGIGTDVVGRAGYGIAGAGPHGGYGYPDIIHGNMIWEIKGPSGVAAGMAKIRLYVGMSEGKYVAGTGYVGRTLDHPYIPAWKVQTTQAAPGVIQYTVIKSQPIPVPVPIPDRAREGRNQRSLNPAPVPVPAYGWSPQPSLSEIRNVVTVFGSLALLWSLSGGGALRTNER